MSVVFGCGFAGVAVKESFHKPRSVAKETDPDQTTLGCWMSQQRQNWLWIGRCIWKSPETFTIYFGKWVPRREVNISSTFHLKTGKRYQNLKSQSTQRRTVMPVKYIISLCSPFFPNGAKLKPQKLVQNVLAEHASKANSKVKPTLKDMKSAVKHIYS